ncbi:hypothetical protein HUJ04_011622 [Dendroctonus ponderosae]|nr:hypothetical protein HUJ04_011622 [Dendroctonus ponderosae]
MKAFIVLCLAVVVLGYTDADDVYQRSKRGFRDIKTISVPKPYPVYIPKPYPVIKQVPIKVQIPIKITVPKPYPVHIPKPYPVPVKVPIHVPYAVKVPYAVAKPYPIEIENLKVAKESYPVVTENKVPYPVIIDSGHHGYGGDVHGW